MNVLMVGPLPPPIGGTTVSFQNLVDYLRSQENIHIEVIDTSRKAHAKNTASNNVRYAVQTFFSILKQIRRYDIVALHSDTRALIFFGPMILMLCKLFGKKSMYRVFGGALDKHYRGRVQKGLLAFVMKADLMLLQTQYLIRFYSERFPKAHIQWFSNSRPPLLEQPDSRSKSQHDNRLRFLHLGHVKPTKGIRDIIEAARILDFDCRIDVFGPLMDGVTRQEFEGVPNLSYRGIVPIEDVPDVMRQYDVLLLPSYHEGEGYPGVILEAYACGLPVISTNWRSIPEVVEDGKSGLLITPRSVDELVQAMTRLDRERDTLERLKEGVQETYKSFDSETWNRQYIAYCAGLL